jgi:hypothetical protein
MTLATQASAQVQAPGSFCERLAGETGMIAERAKSPADGPIWSTRVMNLAQRFLVGGQAMVAMQMTPSDDATVADYKRMSEACSSTGKVLSCTVEGPSQFRLVVNDKESKVAAEAGEKARVEMKGTRITCRNG